MINKVLKKKMLYMKTAKKLIMLSGDCRHLPCKNCPFNQKHTVICAAGNFSIKSNLKRITLAQKYLKNKTRKN